MKFFLKNFLLLNSSRGTEIAKFHFQPGNVLSRMERRKDQKG
jgi:hypothetical protein